MSSYDTRKNKYDHLTPKQQYFAIKLRGMSPAQRMKYCGTVINNPDTPSKNVRDLKVVMEGNRHWFKPRDQKDVYYAEKAIRKKGPYSTYKWRR